MAKYPGADYDFDGYGERNSEKRNSLKSKDRIPAYPKNGEGWINPFNPEKEDTVIFMHPEVAGVYNQGYDNDDPYLGDAPTREDLNYVSAEDVRKRSKGSGW
jgi:hypothetical protein